MNTIIKISTIASVLIVIAFVFGAFTFQNVAVFEPVSIDQAQAFGGGGGDDCDCDTPDPPVIPGCTDPSANNYNSSATVDDGSCTYDVVASCDSLTASPNSLPAGGGNVTLSWATTNASSVSINQGIGSVAADGSIVKNVITDTTFTLTAVGTGGNDTCTAVVTVEPPASAPTCDAFTASPNSLPAGGGNVTLSWATTNVTSVSIDNGVGTVSEDGSTSVNVNANTTYTLTATGVGGTVTCSAPVTVSQPDSFSCDLFQSDKSVVKRGETFQLSWETTNADSVSIDQGIGSVADDGNYTTSVNEDTVYTLTVTKGNETKQCTTDVKVKSGGGGGSNKPRCDLDISATKINAGKEVKLTWDTSRATEVTLKDDDGNILMTTEDLDKSDKKDFFDGEMTIRPVKDTTYTLVAERGSKKRTCEVDLEVTESVTVLETRSQPLVAGISLTQVPYTGFEAGPTLTFIFYALLTLWALFIAYILIIRGDSVMGFSLAGAHTKARYREASVDASESGEHFSEADEYVQSVTAEDVPVDLPVAESSTVGYAAFNQTVVADEVDSFTDLENQAHAQKVLLSSDAMRLFTKTVESPENQAAKFNEVITKGKASFPSEDGWVVLNLARMESLLGETLETTSVSENPVTPTTAGSLAEAIIAGNIVAAYEMIASRPMVALADAAADLDAVYRSRKGEEVSISNMLATSAATLSTEQIEDAIAALTSAVDGTYTDEASAVKMAIMKAVKSVS